MGTGAESGIWKFDYTRLPGCACYTPGMSAPAAISLRPAQAADSPHIKALIHSENLNPMGLDWQRFILAVDEQGRMIGCGQVKSHGDGTRELGSLAVIPECRGQGVAATIIHYLVQANPGVLYLTTRSELGTFYQRFGFRRVYQDEMTPYFKRIYRIAAALKKLGLFGEQELWVMVRE